MASTYPGAFQVGSYFVGQYYQVLKQHPDLVHQFYGDASSMIRVDGDSTQSASTIQHIRSLVMSLNFTSIEIKTINSLDSLYGAVLVMVSGFVRTKETSGSRKFVQTFFLAPQDKGYFVLNDIFQFVEDAVVYPQHPASIPSDNLYHQVQHSAPLLSDDALETAVNASGSLSEQPDVSDYGLEDEARDYVHSIHIEDDPLGEYDLSEHHQQQEYEHEVVEEEILVDETPASFQGAATAVPVQDHLPAAPEEPIEEPPKTKKSYAAILQSAKAQLSSSVAAQPSVTAQPSAHRPAPTTSDWNHIPPPATQQYHSVPTPAPESGVEVAEENFGVEEGESKSVYVRNLSPNVTPAEIKQEFKNFGRIKPDGVVIKNRKDVPGVYYAFVEFEDLIGVQNAIKASPIHLAGRQVYIEERRPNAGIASRGRGRGRGGYQPDTSRGRFGARGLGRGNDEDDYNRLRGNGFYQRGPR